MSNQSRGRCSNTEACTGSPSRPPHDALCSDSSTHDERRSSARRRAWRSPNWCAAVETTAEPKPPPSRKQHSDSSDGATVGCGGEQRGQEARGRDQNQNSTVMNRRPGIMGGRAGGRGHFECRHQLCWCGDRVESSVSGGMSGVLASTQQSASCLRGGWVEDGGQCALKVSAKTRSGHQSFGQGGELATRRVADERVRRRIRGRGRPTEHGRGCQRPPLAPAFRERCVALSFLFSQQRHEGREKVQVVAGCARRVGRTTWPELIVRLAAVVQIAAKQSVGKVCNDWGEEQHMSNKGRATDKRRSSLPTHQQRAATRPIQPA